MKFMIKPEYYDEIKTGERTIDFRASHITFVNEANPAQKFTRRVVRVHMTDMQSLPVRLQLESLFGDERIIAFELEKEKKR